MSTVAGIIQVTELSRPRRASIPVAVDNCGAAGLERIMNRDGGTVRWRKARKPYLRPFQYASPLTRLLSRVSVDLETGCWVWMGNTRGRGVKYGGIRVEMKTYSAHRVAWQEFCGEIPTGLRVCHSCDNPLCVNPHHLWLGTDEDNVRDCRNKGRLNYANGIAAINRRRSCE